MSRKDFILVAAIIRGLPVDAETRAIVASDFAKDLSATNPAFKADLFFQAATGVVALTARKVASV